MLNYKIKIKHLDDAPLLEPYFYGCYVDEIACFNAAFELSKLGYKVACYKHMKDGDYYVIKQYSARVH